MACNANLAKITPGTDVLRKGTELTYRVMSLETVDKGGDGFPPVVMALCEPLRGTSANPSVWINISNLTRI